MTMFGIGCVTVLEMTIVNECLVSRWVLHATDPSLLGIQVQSAGQKLQPFTGDGEISKLVKHFQVGWKYPHKPMLLIIANFKDDDVHKDKYLDTSGQILSQKMIIWSIKALKVHSLFKCFFTVTRIKF